MRIYCDFDGTITTRDTTDYVLARLAPPAWESIEADWHAGRITAAECMAEQIALIEAPDHRLDEVLDEIGIVSGFAELVSWCARRRVPLTVVSDGVDYFIRRILHRHGFSDLPVIANQLAGDAARRRLEQPWRRAECPAGSGVCKCSATRAQETMVYVGDGRSDFCVAACADILFAKDALARHAQEHGLAFLPFIDFHEVLQLVEPLFDSRRTQRTSFAAA